MQSETILSQLITTFTPQDLMFDSPTMCCNSTLTVRKGMSPIGTFVMSLERHSSGGIARRNPSSVFSNAWTSLRSSRSVGRERMRFQMHLMRSSPCLASRASGETETSSRRQAC